MTPTGSNTFYVAIAVAWSLSVTAALADRVPDYETDVKPILQRHCFGCHGEEKQKGGLRLDVKDVALMGGDSGEPAVVPGNAVKSHLLKLVASKDPDEVMPPKGERLKAEEVALLQKWIETGAHWIDVKKAVEETQGITDLVITDRDRSFWSFVPPKAYEPPPVKNAAWARTEIDRFVLAKMEAKGLAPSAEASREVLIRRLSFDLTGLPPTAEEVDAFVADQREDAYERLVERLLASSRFGERMASLWLPLARYAEDQAHQVGSDTKFFYPNAWKYREWVVNAFNRDVPYDQFVVLQIAADKVGAASEDQAALGFIGLGPKYYNRNRVEVMADEWEDRVDTVTRTTLGLTVACARCHDHKFDPVSISDYYALAGVFASTKMVNKTPDGVVKEPVDSKDKKGVDAHSPDTVHVVEDAAPQDLNVFIRGNVQRKGPVAPRRFLTVLSPATPAPFAEGSGRKELAFAIAARTNPLTARVMVNRVWGMLLGRPLVATPSNFGRSGETPTHPELLDDLAVRFMNGGWSIKDLVREIVTSATYRQSADRDSGKEAIDSANELLSRMNRRRLTIEQWRDSVLYLSGNLESGGGKSLELDDPKNNKRTLYARISRLKLNDVLMHFDYPDANVHAEKRSVTTTAGQKLFMLNSPFMIGQAKALSARLHAEEPEGAEKRIEQAYRMMFARRPSRDEAEASLAFLKGDGTAEMSRWEQYAQVLLACNEALYVD